MEGRVLWLGGGKWLSGWLHSQRRRVIVIVSLLVAVSLEIKGQ